MILPLTYSLNHTKQLPVYLLADIIRFDPQNVEEWLNRNDVIIMDIPKQETEENVLDLEKTLLLIDELEESFKIK